MVRRRELWDIEKFVEHIHLRLRDNWDFLFPIYGEPGSGKSYAAFVLGHALDPSFSWDRFEFASQTYIDMMEPLPPGSAGAWDEIVEGGLRVRTMAGDEVDTLKEFIHNRTSRKIHMVCVPDDNLWLKWLAESRPPWRAIVNRRPGWDYSVLEVEQRQKKYIRYKDKWVTKWLTRLRYVLKPDLLDSEEWQKYQEKKDRWRALGRDADKAMQERTDSEDRQVVDEYVDRLSWLPDEIRAFEDEFLDDPIGLKGNGLTDREQLVADLVKKRPLTGQEARGKA